MDDRDHEQARYERDQRIRDTVWAYKRCFDTPDGKAVLADLKKAFAFNMPAYIPTNTRIGGNIQYDDIQGKLRDGQRHVWCHIQNALDSDLEPSGNMDPRDIGVITGLRG